MNVTTGELSSPNAMITGVAADATVCITSYAPTHVVVDVSGSFPR